MPGVRDEVGPETLILASILVACGADTAVDRPSPVLPASRLPSSKTYWIERTDVELDDTLKEACTTATAESEPVLLAFSAPWCGDCKTVRTLEAISPLREELEGWTKVVVDVGRFDRHPELLEAFGVSSIAHWVALQPNCGEPVTRWKRLGTGVFEPSSKPDTTADALTDWLIAARNH